MRSDLPLLASIEIASPCPASWAKMNGGDTKRFCDSCRLHVHDLSAMTAQEAETLLQTHQGELCVRYTKDVDGRILTDEFPSPLRPMRSLILKHCAMAAAFVLLALTAGVHSASADNKPAKAKTPVAKKATKSQAQPPLAGKPMMRPAATPALEELLPPKMGEPDRALLDRAFKQLEKDTGDGVTLGRIRATPAPPKPQEQPPIKSLEKQPAKTPANPKP